MTFSFSTTMGTAKADVFGRVLSTVENIATKEVVSRQETERAISTAVVAWLSLQTDEVTLRDFFAGIEAAVSPAIAKKIERHPLRPASVGPIVEAAREKAEADRAKEERERQKLAELKARYEDKPAAKTQPAAEIAKAAD